jgi:beta-glucosidase
MLLAHAAFASGAATPVASAEPEKIVFPAAFAFGTATAAYQIEGAYQEGGRGLSIWDAFAHTPGKVRTGETGDVAADHYHRFKSDVRLMAQMKLRYYRARSPARSSI